MDDAGDGDEHKGSGRKVKRSKKSNFDAQKFLAGASIYETIHNVSAIPSFEFVAAKLCVMFVPSNAAN